MSKFKKGDKVESKTLGETFKIFEYNEKFGSYRVQNEKGHFKQIHEDDLSEFEEEIVEPEPIKIKENIMKEFIHNKVLILSLIAMFIPIAIVLFFFPIKHQETQIKQKSDIEIITSEIIELEKSKIPEFELQQKIQSIYKDSVKKVSEIDGKIQQKRIKQYLLIK